MSDIATSSRSRRQHALRSIIVDGLWKGVFATRDSSGKERFPLLQLLSNNLDTWNNAAPLSPLLFMTFLSQIIVQSSQEAASTLCAEFVRLLQSMLAKYSAALSQCFAREPSVHSVCSIFLEDGVTHNQLHGEDSSSSLVLRFLSHLLLRQIDAAGKLLIGVIVDAWSLLPLRGGSTRAGELGGEGRLLSLAAALQVLLNILNHAAAQSASIETDADSEAECLWRAAQQLVQQYQVLRYLGGLAVRLAALFLSLSSPQYAQVTYVLLSEESQVDYRAHAQHMEALCAQEQERSRRNSRVKVGSQAVDHEDDADDGFKYVLAASKEECDDYLCGKPVGTFVVRLSPSGAAAPLVTQQMYLCFRADPASEADQEKGALSSSIRHAVVRREEFGAGVVMYRCGSVGPFSSLAELLIEISNRLPSPLLFHHSPPSPSPAPGFSTVSAQLQCRDMNARLWKELEKLLPTLVVAFASSLHTKQEAGKTGAVSNAVLSTTLADDSDDESKATAVTEDEDSSNSPVGTADQARQPECATESMNMWLQVLRVLALQMFSRQNEPLQDLLQRAYAHDMSSVRTDPVTGESNSQSPLSMYSNLVHLKAFFLKASAAYSGMMGALSGEGSFAWSVLIGLYEHAKELECRVKCRLLPTPEILQRLQRAQYQERDTELLAIERLLQLLIKKSQLSSGSDVPLFRSVKFSLASSGFQDVAGSMGYGLGTSGTFVLSDCCDSTELLHALNRYVFELIMLLQPERMSPVPRKSEADNRERTGSKRSKYSNLLEDDDSEDEMAMHYVDPARVSNDDSDSDDGGNQAARAQLQLPDTPIDFTSLSPASPKRVVESSRYPESSVQADGLPEVDAHMVMPQRNSPFIMIQQPRSRGGSNTSLVEQAFEEKRLGRTGGTVGKKNIGNLWHGYVDKVKTKIDKLSTNLKATQQSNLVKASLLNSSALVSRAPSAASIQREILQALIHVLDVLKVDPVQSTSQVSLDTSSACFVVTDKVVECMLSHGLLVQVVKPSELAFGVPQSFYHYVDAFESNVVQDHTTLNERCKIGRHVYYNIYRGINTAAAVVGEHEGQLHAGSVAHLLAAMSSALEREGAVRIAESMTQLANFLKMDDYVLQTVSQADVSIDMQRHVTTLLQNSLPQYSDVRHLLHRFYHVQQSTYFLTLELCLYRNAVFRSLRLRYRLVALLQVDVYHLKEVLAVVPPRSKMTSAVPSVHAGQFNSQASQVHLSPVHQMHTQSLEVYGSFRLGKKVFEAPGAVGASKAGQQAASSVGVERSSSNSLLSEGLFNSSASASSQSRYPSESSSVSPIKRLEAVRAVATPDSSSKVAAVTQQLVNGSVLLPQVTHSSDYDLRLQSLFRLPLPEHLSTLSGGDERQDGCELQSLPYSHLTVSMFEKTFFSDVKIGEVEVSLLDMGEKNVVRDWFPLSIAEASGKPGSKPVASWLVFMQVKIRPVMMQVDHGGAGSGTNIPQAREVGGKSSKVLAARKGGNLLGQLEDFF